MRSFLSKIAVVLKPKRRWFQYRLRTLLLVMTVFAVWFGVWADRARKQRKAVDAIREFGGLVRYADEYHPLAETDEEVSNSATSGPLLWGRELLGKDFVANVASVHLQGNQFSDRDIEHLKSFRKLEQLNLQSSRVTDAGLERLRSLTGLQHLNLVGTQISDAGMQHLERLTRLESLHLSDTAVGDSGLRRLEGLRNLRTLDLRDTKVTDDGLQ